MPHANTEVPCAYFLHEGYMRSFCMWAAHVGCQHLLGMGVCQAQMWPICGDGLTLQIQHTKAGSAAPEVLMSRRHPPGSHEKPQRQKVRHSPLWILEGPSFWHLHMTLCERECHKTLFDHMGLGQLLCP